MNLLSTPATRLRLPPVKLEDLQVILSRMTPRPWRWNGEHMLGPEQFEPNSRGEQVDIAPAIIESDSNVYGPREHDAAGILALVNNADALMELVSTLREMFEIISDMKAARDRAQRRLNVADMEVTMARRDVDDWNERIARAQHRRKAKP